MTEDIAGIDSLQGLLMRGETVVGGSPEHLAMTAAAYETRRILMDLNCRFHTHGEIVELFSRLTHRRVDDSFGLFPPFYTEYGRNISVGKDVFINAGCQFQDHGGIRLDDGVLVGHNVVMATLNHPLDWERRSSLEPAPIHVCEHVWIGAGAIILPGVTVGARSVVGAGAVVTRDVPPDVVVAGVPARVIKRLDGGSE